jgi:gamma-glutamylcyclotransferase (GGCT)/AIG2-like uncharacterized protein YtfP
MKKQYVFVYGTLRSNLSNHYLLRDAKQVSKQCWTRGVLYDVGCGYPAMAAHPKNRVYGELYAVTEKELSQLDQLEGFHQENSPYNHYERVQQIVYTDQGSYKAFTYIYKPERVNQLKAVLHNDWKYHLLMEQDSLYYFAYGSCMDDNRFKKHKVDHLFTNVIGKGVLQNYKLAFTRKTSNGSRADVVEGSGVVEGKVYRISKEALEYLFDREGVKYNTYRSTFVDIQTSSGVLKDVLTYVVIDKQPETAPPIEYAEEMVRGANGLLSEEYVRKLLEDFTKKFAIDLNGIDKTQ